MKSVVRNAAVTLGTAGAILAVTAGSAFADNCANVSRPAPACWSTDTCAPGPIFVGRWVWLPSLEPGAPAVWGFGTPDNFTNGQSDGLTQLANTKSSGAVCATPNRQFTGDLSTMHGVLSSEACGL